WTLTLFSSLACVLGACFIYIDVIIRRLPGCASFDLINDKRILVSGMSIGSGVLLFTALNKMLPEALDYLTPVFERKSVSHAVLMAGYLAGVIVCMLLNNILLPYLTPDSVIHCCGDENDDHHAHQDAHSSATDETTPLVQQPSMHSLRRSKTSFSQCKRTDAERAGPCAGYSDLCAADEKNDFLRIGFQTALAISFHKAPEGLILFLSSHADAALGFRVFLALAIHNLVEGFTIAYPLYLAFENRFKALGAAVLLGGLSQPVGALIGFAITKAQGSHKFDERSLDLSYGLLFSATAGFMSFISVVSMLPQAIKND
ncbi:Zinc/iron permease, partial [Protomyces lactucae-debilis]